MLLWQNAMSVEREYPLVSRYPILTSGQIALGNPMSSVLKFLKTANHAICTFVHVVCVLVKWPVPDRDHPFISLEVAFQNEAACFWLMSLKAKINFQFYWDKKNERSCKKYDKLDVNQKIFYKSASYKIVIVMVLWPCY